MSRRLIEAYRRKPEFSAKNSTPITLADGQEWYFPRPWTEIVPRWEDGKAVAVSETLSCGEDLDALIEAIGASDDPLQQILGLCTLAGYMLMRNYDLEPSEIERLLTVRAGDATSEAMLEHVVGVATGRLYQAFRGGVVRHPKALAAGSESH